MYGNIQNILHSTFYLIDTLLLLGELVCVFGIFNWYFYLKLAQLDDDLYVGVLFTLFIVRPFYFLSSFLYVQYTRIFLSVPTSDSF